MYGKEKLSTFTIKSIPYRTANWQQANFATGLQRFICNFAARNHKRLFAKALHCMEKGGGSAITRKLTSFYSK